MRYAKIKHNDVANAPGISVSFYTQGCFRHCKNCFNPETWDYLGGSEFTPEILQEIISALTENGVKRSLSILGGEPLCPDNAFLTLLVINEVKIQLPETKIYVWTGYTLEELKELGNTHINQILNKIDYLIDGPYIDSQRDITLKMRGSRNQRILQKGVDF